MKARRAAKRGRPRKQIQNESAKRQAAILRLAQGYSQRRTADLIKIDRKTLAEWLDQKDFARAVADEAAEITDGIRADFLALQGNAVECLKRQMGKGGAAGVRAAIEVLKVAGVMSMPRIPQRIAQLFRGKKLEVIFRNPGDLPADGVRNAGGSARIA